MKKLHEEIEVVKTLTKPCILLFDIHLSLIYSINDEIINYCK